jgi:hypothetical protein
MAVLPFTSKAKFSLALVDEQIIGIPMPPAKIVDPPICVTNAKSPAVVAAGLFWIAENRGLRLQRITVAVAIRLAPWSASRPSR